MFYTEEDRVEYLKKLAIYVNEFSTTVYAYCLMDDHVHFLIKAENNDLSKLFQRLGTSYASYFIRKYEHVGHVFQNRFKSEPVNDEKYFLAALRYILKNPEAAGICRWDQYRWSSAGALFYPGSDAIADVSVPAEIANGFDNLKNFMRDDSEEFQFYDIEKRKTFLSDEKAAGIIREVIGNENILVLQKMGKKERNFYLAKIKKAGISIRQIERVTGINRNAVQRSR